jgi:hypothetical protein
VTNMLKLHMLEYRIKVKNRLFLANGIAFFLNKLLELFLFIHIISGGQLPLLLKDFAYKCVPQSKTWKDVYHLTSSFAF